MHVENILILGFTIKYSQFSVLRFMPVLSHLLALSCLFLMHFEHVYCTNCMRQADQAGDRHSHSQRHGFRLTGRGGRRVLGPEEIGGGRPRLHSRLQDVSQVLGAVQEEQRKTPPCLRIKYSARILRVALMFYSFYPAVF